MSMHYEYIWVYAYSYTGNSGSTDYLEHSCQQVNIMSYAVKWNDPTPVKDNNHEVIVLVCYTVAIQLHVIIHVLCTVFINYIWEKAQWKINQCKGIELQLSVDVELIKVLANWIVAVSNILLLVLVYHLETSERAISLWSDNEPVVDSTFHVDNWAHSHPVIR